MSMLASRRQGDLAITLARPAKHLEQQRGVALEVVLDLVVQEHDLGAGGLVPLQERLRGLALVQPQRPPGQPDGGADPAGEQLALGQRHGGRQGQNRPPQPARGFGIDALVTAGRRVGLNEGLHQHLGDEKAHQRAAGEQSGHGGRFAGGQFLAVLAQVADERAGGDRAAVASAGRAGIEAPGVMARIGIPQIAFRAGQAGVALRAVAEIGQRLRLEADPGHCRPHKRAGSPAAARQILVAERAAHEFDPAGEGFVVDLFGTAEIAQFQPVAVVHVHRGVAAGFHQDPAGARIADVQHQVHIHRAVEPGGRPLVHEGEAQARRLDRPEQQRQHRQIGRDRVRTLAQFGLVHPARGAAAQFKGVEPLVQPFPHPFLFQEPAGVGLGVGQGEFLAGLHVQRTGREIGPAFAGRQQLGVEGQGDAVGMALGIRCGQFHQPRPRPVGRPLIEQMIAVRTRLPDAQKRQRNPDAVENAGGLGGVQRIDLFRLNRPPVPGHELAAGVVGVQSGQNGATVGAGFRQEGPRDPRFVEVEAEIQKLDGGVWNQVDERAELLEFRQHGRDLCKMGCPYGIPTLTARPESHCTA